MCILSLVGCSEEKDKYLKAFYVDEGLQNIEVVVIVDGSTGFSKKIKDKKMINDFLSKINDVVYTPLDNQEDRDGWSYGITLIDGKKQFQFTLYHIKGTYYQTTPDILPIVDQFYKNLDIE